MSSVSPGGVDLVPTAPDQPLLTCFIAGHLPRSASSHFGYHISENSCKGSFAKKLPTFTCTNFMSRTDEGVQYQVKVCVHHESNSGGPMGGSWDQIWPTGALRGPWGPPKGHLGAKTSPFRAPGVQKGPDTRSKCTWIMNLTQAGQCGAVGTKSGPLGPSKDLVGPQKGLLGPKRAPVGT